jgi:hypothetical protein
MILGHVGAFVSLWHEFRISVEVESGVLNFRPFMSSHKFCCTENQAFAFATIYEQPFLLPHYCGISSLPNINLQLSVKEPFILSRYCTIGSLPSVVQWPRQMVCCVLNAYLQSNSCTFNHQLTTSMFF